MLRFPLVALVLAALALPAAAQSASCPVTGIVTGDFGTGTGLGSPVHLSVALDAAGCSLKFLVQPLGPDAPISDHFILYGTSPLPVPFLLPSPFWVPGCFLDVAPLDALGAFPGDTSVIALPPSPALVGATIYFEAVHEYAVLSPMPLFGDTQGVKVQFQ